MMKLSLHRISIGLCALSLMLQTACSHSHSHEHGAESNDCHETEHHSPDDIVLDSAKAQAAGVQVSTVQRGTFHDVIQVSGSLVAASCDETTIVATVGGVVDHAQHISEGMAISAGTVVYRIVSGHLQEGDQAERARIQYLAAKQEYERALPLLEDKIISESEFNSLRTSMETARLAYEAIGRHSSSRGVEVKSPVTGYMKECLVKDGDYVQVGTPLMVVTKNQHLYLRAEVPVRYYAQMSQIHSAKFRTQYSDEIMDLRKLNGHLLSSGKSVVSTSSYVPVTFQLDNTRGIVPGSYAEVYLLTGERPDVLAIPTTALTEEQGIYYVYIETQPEHYRKQEVHIGSTDGELTEITEGLCGGERVVVRGAINVRLASATAVLPAHNHSH